jgi:hypothetical protein
MKRNRLEWSKMCLKAMQIAMAVLSDKVDKSGMTTFWHALRVSNSMKGWQLQVIALLHDCVEDGKNLRPEILALIGVPQWLVDEDGPDMTYRKLEFLGINDTEVLASIEAITKRPGESYSSYLPRVKANHDARLVKLQDINDNMSVERLSHLPADKVTKLAYKYCHAMQFLRDIDGDGTAEYPSYEEFIKNMQK